MVPPTVMTLIEHHKRIVRQLYVTPTQTIQKHLGYHHSYSSLFHLVQKLFLCRQVSLNPLSSSNSGVLTPFPVHTNHLIVQVLFTPFELNIVTSQFLSQILSETLVVYNGTQGLLNSLGLLLDQLNSIGQKDNLFTSTVLTKIVVHRTYSNTSLTSTRRQVNNTVTVTTALNQSSLERTQIYITLLKS